VSLLGLRKSIPRRRTAYVEWYRWAQREVGGGHARQEAAVRAALLRLEQGASPVEAAAAARQAARSAQTARMPQRQPGPLRRLDPTLSGTAMVIVGTLLVLLTWKSPVQAAVGGPAGVLIISGALFLLRPVRKWWRFRALAIRERMYGPENPYIATCLNNLALWLRAEGNSAAARPLFERAVEIWERAYGNDHPHVAIGLAHLADLLQAQGEPATARPLLERALGIREKALGPNDGLTIVTRHALAELALTADREEDARGPTR
jgi:tetratricopeptide (TPR) repeat protein